VSRRTSVQPDGARILTRAGSRTPRSATSTSPRTTPAGLRIAREDDEPLPALDVDLREGGTADATSGAVVAVAARHAKVIESRRRNSTRARSAAGRLTPSSVRGTRVVRSGCDGLAWAWFGGVETAQRAPVARLASRSPSRRRPTSPSERVGARRDSERRRSRARG
jgi:hypothetical protein